MPKDLTDTGRWRRGGLDAGAMGALQNDLPPTQLWSLLLTVMERRARDRDAAALLRQWCQDRFVAVAPVDQRTALEIDRHLFAAAQAFEALELSPLAPLGACSAIAPTSQNRIVSTARGSEVVSDPTNVLALECARRLRADSSRLVRLATSHRCVRSQPVPKGRGFAAHFRIFCLATAGHERKDQAFLVAALTEHIRIHLDALERLARLGYLVERASVKLLATPEQAHVADRIAAELTSCRVLRGELRQPYYDGLRFTIDVASNEGMFPLIDGGSFDWVGKLAANRKLRFVASALGSQLIAAAFRADRARAG